MLKRMSLPRLTEGLAAVARDLAAEDVEQTLEKAVALCVDLIEGCEAAAVSLVRQGQVIETPACTDSKVLRGDELQYDMQRPCLERCGTKGGLHGHRRWSRRLVPAA